MCIDLARHLVLKLLETVFSDYGGLAFSGFTRLLSTSLGGDSSVIHRVCCGLLFAAGSGVSCSVTSEGVKAPDHVVMNECWGDLVPSGWQEMAD